MRDRYDSVLIQVRIPKNVNYIVMIEKIFLSNFVPKVSFSSREIKKSSMIG